MPLARTDTSVDVPLNQIKPSGQKWRRETADAGLEELAASLKKQGQIHPISLLRDGAASYEIIQGHRRFAAAQQGELRTIRADLYNWEPAEGEDLDVAVAVFLKGANMSEELTLLEKARMFEDIQRETGFDTDQLADMFQDESAETITDALQLLDISEDALEIIERNPDRFTEAHLRMLADYSGNKRRAWRMKPEEQTKVAREIVEQQDKIAVRDPRKFETRIKSVVNVRRREEQAKRAENKKKERRQSDPVKTLFKLIEQTDTALQDLLAFEVNEIKQIDPVDKGFVLQRTYTMIEQLGDFAEEKLTKLPQRKPTGAAA